MPPRELSVVNTVTGPIDGGLVRVVQLDCASGAVVEHISVDDIKLALIEDGLRRGPHDDVCFGLVSVPIEGDAHCVSESGRGEKRLVHKK